MGSERTRRRPARWAILLGAALLAAPVLLPTEALAQPSASDRETARSLMTQGDQAFDAKDYPAALKAYQAAHAIMRLPSTGIWVAKTEVALGMLVEARDMALEVKGLPKEPNEKQAMVVARKEATQLADSLATRIPSLEVQVSGPSDPSSVSLTIDSAAIPAAATGAPRKVNPGHHVVTASAPGFAKTTKEIDVKEGEAAKLPLALPAEASPPPVVGPAPGPAAPAAPAPTTAPAPSSSGPPPDTGKDTGHGTSPLVYVGFIAGGVGVGVGAVTGILSLGRASKAKDSCNDANQCAPKAADDISASKTMAWVSNIGFGVGVVGVAVGVIALVTGGSSSSAPPAQGKVSVVPTAGLDGIGVAGRF